MKGTKNTSASISRPSLSAYFTAPTRRWMAVETVGVVDPAKVAALLIDSPLAATPLAKVPHEALGRQGPAALPAPAALLGREHRGVEP